MSKDWIKSKEAELVTQAQDVSAKSPIRRLPTAWLPRMRRRWRRRSRASSTSTTWRRTRRTRTKVTVEEKNFAKDTLVARMRSYGRRISVNPSVSDALKVGLG
jgi:hypothetical protein